VQAQQSKWVGYQGTLDYQGSDFTGSATLANPDPLSGSGVAVLQYLQAITPKYELSLRDGQLFVVLWETLLSKVPTGHHMAKCLVKYLKILSVSALWKWDVWGEGDTQPSYLLYFVLHVYDNKRHS